MPSTSDRGPGDAGPRFSAARERFEDLRFEDLRPWLIRGGLGLLLLLVLVMGYQATRTALALQRVKTDAATLVSQVRSDKPDAARATLRDLTRQAAVAHGHSDNVLWSAAAAIPWIGTDVEAVKTAASAIDSAARTALPQAMDLYVSLDEKEMRTANGRFNLDAIAALEPRFEELGVELQPADQQLQTLDAEDVKISPVRDATRDLQDRMRALVTLARAGKTATRVLPPMLGEDGPRTYLLAVQNNAEPRATGGLPGSLLVVRARDGKLTLGRSLTRFDFPTLSSPVLPQSAEERTLYGPGPVLDIREVNETPDFPRVATIIDAFYAQKFGDRLDGVLATDPVALATLLRATGPIKVGEEVFTSENAVRKLLNTVYLRYEDPDDQDAYLSSAARGIFNRLTSSRVNQVGVVEQLATITNQRRFLVWSHRPEENAEFSGTAVAGELPRGRSAGERVGMYLNESTESKLGYYLDHVGGVRPISCSDDGIQRFESRLRLRSTAPQDTSGLPDPVAGDGSFAPRGALRMSLRIYGPAGGRITGVTANGKKLEARMFTHKGRPVAFVWMLLRPQGKIDVTAQVRTAAGQRGRPTVEWTPGVHEGATSVSAPSACD